MSKNRSVECRFCSSQHNLRNALEKRGKDDDSERLLYILWLTTGIQIQGTDVVSTLVCNRCVEIAVKLHKYRTMAVANDKRLKMSSGQPYEPPDLVNLPNLVTSNRETETDEMHKIENCSVKHPHPSVSNLLKSYNVKLNLPKEVFSSNINPIVKLDLNEVDRWYKGYPNTKDRNVDQLDEGIPKKKKKRNRMESPNDKKESSAPLLESDVQNMLFLDKILEAFVCPLCNKICYSKPQFMYHKKSHLKCTMCKAKFMDFDKSYQHQIKKTCVKDMNKSTVLETITIDEDGNDKDVLKSVENEKDIEIIHESFPENQPSVAVKNEVELVSTKQVNSEYSSPTACKSDKNDNDTQNVSSTAMPESGTEFVSKHPLLKQILFNSGALLPNSFVPNFLGNNCITEEELKKILLTKYYSKKEELATNTFEPTLANIDQTSKGIVVKDIFGILHSNRIPVKLEAGKTISVDFIKNIEANTSDHFDRWYTREVMEIQDPKRTNLVTMLRSTVTSTSTTTGTFHPLPKVAIPRNASKANITNPNVANTTVQHPVTPQIQTSPIVLNGIQNNVYLSSTPYVNCSTSQQPVIAYTQNVNYVQVGNSTSSFPNNQQNREEARSAAPSRNADSTSGQGTYLVPWN